VKTIDEVLAEDKRTRAQAVAELHAGAIAPAVRAVPTPRNARNPVNRYDSAHPDRDPRERPILQGTVDLTPEQQKILNALSAEDARRFRKEKGLPAL